MNNDGWGQQGAGTSDMRQGGNDLQHAIQHTRSGGPMKERREAFHRELEHQEELEGIRRGNREIDARTKRNEEFLEQERKRHEHAIQHHAHHMERHHSRHHDSQHGHDEHKHHYESHHEM